MEGNLTEQQQIELLKKFWKENSWSIIVGVVLAIVVVLGWRYYQYYVTSKLTHASAIFQQMITDTENGANDNAEVLAKRLSQHFPRTVYATSAKLLLAKQFVNNKDYDQAILQLQWVKSHSKIVAYRQVASIRLARVYLEQNKLDQALKVLSKVDDPQYNSQILEAKGDIYIQQGKLIKARELYQEALTQLPNNIENPILKMKLRDLPMNAKRGSEK